jgi:DNA-binding transcriptional LysR family regulator
MDVNLRQIRAFLAVARFNSFTRAAVLLNVTQPALTMQIRNLEQQLGLALFDRSKRSVALTRVGRDLLPSFQRTMQDFDATLGSARDVAAQKRGVVRLAVLPSVAASILPDAISEFRKTRPDVTFDLRDVIAGQVLSLVQNEQVDFGVMGGTTRAAGIETVFEAQDRLHVIFPKGHAIGRAKATSPDAVAKYPLILMQRDTSVRAIVDRGFAAAGLMPVPTCEVIYMMTAVAMVRAGLGLTILPGSAREIQAESGLQSRPIDSLDFVRPVAIIKRAGRTLAPLSESFLHRLAARIELACRT